jgi:hypothetical protein
MMLSVEREKGELAVLLVLNLITALFLFTMLKYHKYLKLLTLVNTWLANFNAAVTKYSLDKKIYGVELSSLLFFIIQDDGAMFTLLGQGGGGGAGLRATQVSIKETNVNKIEDFNHLNSNHKQRFTRWDDLFFCF